VTPAIFFMPEHLHAGTDKQCSNAAFCMHSTGFCGSTDSHCGAGCQQSFGTCSGGSSGGSDTPERPDTTPVTPNIPDAGNRGSGVGSIISAQLWNTMFPMRNKAPCESEPLPIRHACHPELLTLPSCTTYHLIPCCTAQHENVHCRCKTLGGASSSMRPTCYTQRAASKSQHTSVSLTFKAPCSQARSLTPKNTLPCCTCAGLTPGLFVDPKSLTLPSGQGAGRDFYSHTAFLNAAAATPGFGTSGDAPTNKRELAAFLAHISQETTGGGNTGGLCWIIEGEWGRESVLQALSGTLHCIAPFKSYSSPVR
jgi:hypothetical protein